MAGLYISHMRRESKLRADIEMFKKNEEILEYLVAVIPMISQKNPNGQDIHLEGLIRGFKENSRQNISDLVSDDLILQGEFDDERRAIRNKLWAVFMKNLVLECLKKEKKSPELRLIMGFIFYHKLGNKYRALYELSQALSLSPGLGVQFYIYRFSKIIEFDLMNEDEKLTEERGVDYNALVYFNDGFAAFQRRIMKACKYQKKLFEEVEEKTPDVFRMYTYGHRLMKEREVLKKKFDQLCAISPSHAQNLTLYAGFLEVVLNDSESAYALHEKHAQLANKHLDSLKNSTELVKDKYEINSLTAIIVASGEINRLGFCLSANNLLETLYGFTDKDLIGQNVSKMVPEYYRADHEEHFKRFFEREEETRPVLNTERIVYAQNFRGYIVPSSIMIKTLPEVNGYLKIVAFLTPSDKLNKTQQDPNACGLIIENDNNIWKIAGITENCDKLCGIRLSRVQSKKGTEGFGPESIMPELFNPGNLEKAKVGQLDIKLDTTKLNQDQGEDQDDDKFEATDAKDFQDEIFDNSESNDNIEDRKQRADDKRFTVMDIKIRAIPADPKSKGLFISFSPNKENPIDDVDPDKADFKEVEEDVVKRDVRDKEKGEIPEDRRKIQEFYSTLKEGTFPKGIKSMVRLYVLSIICLLTVAVLALYFNLDLKSRTDEALTVMKLSHLRSSLIPQIIFYCQSVKILADGHYSDNATLAQELELESKTKIAYLVNLLQHINVDAVNYQIKMDKDQQTNTKDQLYDITLLLSNNETKVFQKDFNDALLQFVTSSSLIQNESLSNWKFDLINSPLRDYFYNEQNGLLVLREAADVTTHQFYDYYTLKIGKFTVWLIVQVSLLVFILFLTIFTLICTHVRLLRIYKQVTIFFGEMTQADIQQLRNNVDMFEATYLKNVEDIDSEEEDFQGPQQPGDPGDDDERRELIDRDVPKTKYDAINHADDNDHDDFIHKNNQDKEFEEEAEEVDEEIAREERRKKQREQSQKIAEIKKKEEQDKQIEVEAAEKGKKDNIQTNNALRSVQMKMLSEKKEHLEKKKTIYMKIPYCSIVFNGVLLVSLFTVTLYQSFAFVEQLNWIMPLHLSLGERIPNLQFLVDLTRDSLLTNTYKSYNNKILFNKYMEDVENLEDKISSYMKSSVPSNFDDFNSLFIEFSLQNLCKVYNARTGEDLLPSEQECIIENNPILSKGESISIISTINYARELVLSYKRNPGPAQLTSALRSTNMQVLTKLSDSLNKTVSVELDSFEGAWQKSNKIYINISVPLFVGLIIYLLLTLLAYLLKTLRKFSRRVRNNKGLLALIPQSMILKNPDLKKRIFNSELREVFE